MVIFCSTQIEIPAEDGGEPWILVMSGDLILNQYRKGVSAYCTCN